jgi:hypothetical protein
MHFHQNHCYCLTSHWDNDWYDASYMVIIDMHDRNYDRTIPLDKQIVSPDWKAMIDINQVIDQDRLIFDKKFFSKIKHAGKFTDQQLEEMAMTDCPAPKPAVIDWLTTNVAPETAKRTNANGKGWAMGNDRYRLRQSHGELTFWFYRRSDAMKFIKEWSVYTKPTTYLNYFKDDLRKLIDGKLTKVDQL